MVRASIGMVEHGNAVILVTLDEKGALVDRRRAELTQGLPTHPYHHEGAWAVGRYLDSPWARPVTLAEALNLVQTVAKAALHGARQCLDQLDGAIQAPAVSIAIRVCPPLPDSDEGRIRDNRAQVVADSVMYRMAMATAAEERGWRVEWYDRGNVMRQAAGAIGVPDIIPTLNAIGKRAGPPWQAQHKLAAAAALALLALPEQPTRSA
jgi:hypothetical protein